MIPELELWVLDKFNERDEQTPRMRAIDYEPFKQNPRYLLLDGFSVGLRKQVQQSTTEVMCVAVGIAKLVRHGIQEQVTTCNLTEMTKLNKTKTNKHCKTDNN